MPNQENRPDDLCCDETWVETICNSYANGNMGQMTTQINEYGLYDFWSDLKEHIAERYADTNTELDVFTNITIIYHRINGDR